VSALLTLILIVFSTPTDCTTARAVRPGDTVACSGLLVPSSDVRTLLEENAALGERVVELQAAAEMARIELARARIDLEAAERRLVVYRNTLAACESSVAPPPTMCPQPWGGWPWVAAGVGAVVGGFGGYGVGRATCP
jgi:hypothetical protein